MEELENNVLFYDGSKLLSLRDINGNIPEIFMVSGNRSAGKTTYFSKMLVNRYKKQGKKFMIMYRYSNELCECHDKFFKDINKLFFHGDIMESKARQKEAFFELFLNGDPCGYAVALNAAEKIKKCSHLLSDVESMFFDEFQSENDAYVPDEIRKFQSIHVSVSRGGGKMSRYVPVYMAANTVTILNPYYTALGIAPRLRSDTKYLRGDGFVVEHAYNESAKKAQEESAFNRAFAGSDYQRYSSEGVYLNDNKAFIGQPSGYSSYLATIRYNGTSYGIRRYPDSGVIYAGTSYDDTYPLKVVVTTGDHEKGFVMMSRNDMLIDMLRWHFRKGLFRFQNMGAKEAIINSIAYHID